MCSWLVRRLTRDERREAIDEAGEVEARSGLIVSVLVRDADAWESTSGPLARAMEREGISLLDEPTDLPKGDIVYLQPVDTDEPDHRERALLHEALRESVDQMKAGQAIGATEALAELRAHR